MFLSVSIATISNFLQICTLWRYNYETSQSKIGQCESAIRFWKIIYNIVSMTKNVEQTLLIKFIMQIRFLIDELFVFENLEKWYCNPNNGKWNFQICSDVYIWLGFSVLNFLSNLPLTRETETNVYFSILQNFNFLNDEIDQKTSFAKCLSHKFKRNTNSYIS